MIIYPAIDFYDGKAVRLYKGDYNKMTVYNENPALVANDFKIKGAKAIHMVDLEGAKSGLTPNFKKICEIKQCTGLFCEVGGGIRNIETIDRYISAGIDRVILGTAAVTEENFVKLAAEKYAEKIAVGIDIKDSYVAIKGWTEKSNYTAIDFCKKMKEIGITTFICTDISKDGAMKGTNHSLYNQISLINDINIIASGGVSTINDVKLLAKANTYGAIIGKAYYTGAIDLAEAIEVAK